MKYKFFLINMDKSTDRLQRSKLALENYGIDFDRISGVNLNLKKYQALGKHYSQRDNKKHYHKSLNLGEIGCYLSHRQAWQQILTDDLDFAIVLEDDFLISGDLSQLIEEIKTLEQPWDLIKLAELPEKRKVISSKWITSFNLVRYNKLPARTCAQAISKSGAKKLLKYSESFFRPVDIDIQWHWEIDLFVFGLKPYVFIPREDTDSDIDNFAERHKEKNRLMTKWLNQIRFAYYNYLYTK